jgi:hypothetical protein
MDLNFSFQCPECKKTYKSNKDLGGRIKRCADCRGTFTIKRTATVSKGAPPAPEVLMDPELPIDQVFTALHEWQKAVPSLPGSFAREITFGHFDPVYRVTLEVVTDTDGRQEKHRARRETSETPAVLGDEARNAARKVVDLKFEHTSDLAVKLADKPPIVREAAERLAKENRPPEGGRFASRHLVVEHLQVWKAHWSFHQAEGTAWFFGKPLRILLPDPPRRSALPALLGSAVALAAVAGLGWVLWEYDLIKPGTLRSAAAPAPAAPAKPARSGPLAFSKDGIVQLEDGTFLRGTLERAEEAVLVRASGRTDTLGPWQIESLHIDAPVFLKNEGRRLEDLESRVVSAGESAPRQALIAQFLEVHRQKERWTRLSALSSASELPADPQKRLEGLRALLEQWLEKSTPVANPTTAPAPAPGAPAVKVVEPSPAAKLAARLFAGLPAAAADPAARSELAKSLEALKSEKLPQADLVQFALLRLQRADVDSGLVVDRLRIRNDKMDQVYEGAFEKATPSFAKLVTPSGEAVVAFKEKDGWVAQLPGGIRVDPAQVTVSPGARSASGDRISAVFDALPPERWMDAPASVHLLAARAAAAPAPASKDRGFGLLRALAAGHASTALRLGSPAEILEARQVLIGLGYAQGGDGRWERPEDRRAAQMGALLKAGKPEDARALLPGSKGGTDFHSQYRAAAVQFQAPMKTLDDLARATAALDQAQLQAFTPGESKHVLALKSTIAGFGLCPACGGGPSKLCWTCRGKGTRTEACLPCNGQGYIVTVGAGATGNKTCEVCKGKPIRGTRPCEKCEGKGKRACAKCQGVTRLPTPTDVARTRPCPSCAGAGSHGDAIGHACGSCAGLGVQLVPAGAGEAVLP